VCSVGTDSANSLHLRVFRRCELPGTRLARAFEWFPHHQRGVESADRVFSLILLRVCLLGLALSLLSGITDSLSDDCKHNTTRDTPGPQADLLSSQTHRTPSPSEQLLQVAQQFEGEEQ